MFDLVADMKKKTNSRMHWCLGNRTICNRRLLYVTDNDQDIIFFS